MEIIIIKIIICILMFELGGAIGSGLACLKDRKLTGESWITSTRSHCDSCGHVLGILDLIPVISYIAIKGKCRYCKAPIPNKTFKYELVFALVFLVLGIILITILL